MTIAINFEDSSSFSAPIPPISAPKDALGMIFRARMHLFSETGGTSDERKQLGHISRFLVGFCGSFIHFTPKDAVGAISDAKQMFHEIVLSMAPPPPPTTRLPARPLPQTFQNEAPGGRKWQPKCAPKSLEKGSPEARKWLQNGSRSSRGPAESRSSFLMVFWPRWSRSWWPLGAVLAALGPLLPRLGQLLALLGAVLGLPGRSPEGPGEGLGGSLGRCFWSSAPEPDKSSFSQTLGCFFSLFFKSRF